MSITKLGCILIAGQIVMALCGVWFIWPPLVLYFWITARRETDKERRNY